MQTLTKVVAIAVVPPYGLSVEFSDGSSGIYDCSNIVARNGPMVQPLRDESYFRRVFIECGAPTWPNGYDMAPWAMQAELRQAGRLVGVRSSGRAAAG